MNSFKVNLLILTGFSFWYDICLSHDMEGRIVDGDKAFIRDYAHAALLRVRRSDNAAHICGSSVLSQEFLLSAAHCFYELGVNQVIVFAGHEDYRKSSVTRRASSVILHEDFSLKTVQNDIALVLLKETLPLGANIKRIILKSSFPKYVTGTLAGWGYINDNDGPQSNFLQMVKQTVHDKRDCKNLNLRPGMLCAGSLVATESRPSKGDSGSGLITKKYQIVGILSYKLHLYPALPVYTNVSYFYSWIKELTLRKRCNL